ncbi:hypothetical protein B296_00007998 [Ensete ventricosum]|uniref:Uncharacterized protein n=1 Tax=Ensete ventricosum TaxID=4639 RepID=A0A426Z4E5_ENSVE|nr:hypothetical protein B296_00007998 [Ensete ventricosum]
MAACRSGQQSVFPWVARKTVPLWSTYRKSWVSLVRHVDSTDVERRRGRRVERVSTGRQAHGWDVRSASRSETIDLEEENGRLVRKITFMGGRDGEHRQREWAG